MRAIIVREYGDETVLNLEETESPAPNEGQILIEIKAAGVNPVDTYVRQGNHISAPPLPFTPGKDAAGIVAEVGEGVSKFQTGDRVYLAGSITGTYAEFALCEEGHVFNLPDNATYEQGAGVFVPYATAFRALFKKAGIEPGEKVLVHGASGAVGIAAVQLAKNAGATVYGTAGSKKGLELVGKVGAEAVFDHSVEGYIRDIKKASGGVDVILEMLANINLVKDFEMLNKFGRIVIIGSRGSIDFNPRLAMTSEATIMGMSLFNAAPDEFEEIHKAIYIGLSEGFLSPVVGKSFQLEEAAQAHREIIGSKAYGKIVLHCKG